MLSQGRIARLIEGQDGPGLAKLFDRLTPTQFSASARQMALTSNLTGRLAAVGLIATELARGTDPPQGGALGAAILAVARRHLDDPAHNPGLIAESAAQGAYSLAQAEMHAGHFEKVVSLSAEMERLLDARTDGQTLGLLQIAAIDALIALNRLEQAEQVLRELEASGRRIASLQLTRDKLADRLRSVTALADTRPLEQRAGDANRQTNVAAVEALQAFAEQDPDTAAVATGLEALIQSAQEEASPKDAWEAFDRANRGSKALAELIGLSSSELRVWKDRVFDTTGTAFRENGGHDPALLVPALRTFRAAIDWFDEHGHREDGSHARWCAYLAERRLKRIDAALDTLEELAGRLEQDRASIADPLRRAADRANFPLLMAMRTECASLLGDPHRMFAGIEAAKGRALADLRTAADGVACNEAALRAAPAEASALVAHHKIVYVTFLAIDEAIFAVAIWPDGAWHHARIPMDETQRKEISRRVAPDRRRLPTRREAFDLGAALAPLFDWLAPLLPALPPGGHLVVSPDAELHLWPLHMAATPTGPLGLTVGMSRVHGIDTLRRLSRTPPHRPDRSVAVYIPAQDEADAEAKAAAMRRTIAALPAPITVSGAKADAAWFKALDGRDAVLCLNAHGTFPDARIVGGVDPNPFSSAGVLLAAQGRLPKRSASWPDLLTPELVLSAPNLALDRATVVLQACVSGLSKEGQGGDALGLEWALLARGAEAVLATHWDVDYRSAGAFCRHFLSEWLERKQSRVSAWQRAMAATLADPEGGSGDDWAAFSLSGDWR